MADAAVQGDRSPAEGRKLSTQEAVNLGYSRSGYLSEEDTQFTAGESPVEIVINDNDPTTSADLGRNAHMGHIACDKAADDSLGDMQVELAEKDGSTYGDVITLKNGDILPLSGMNVAKIRITHTGTDCGYRVYAR